MIDDFIRYYLHKFQCTSPEQIVSVRINQSLKYVFDSYGRILIYYAVHLILVDTHERRVIIYRAPTIRAYRFLSHATEAQQKNRIRYTGRDFE